ncbi:universal stress protein [Haloparvum sedimenti]|uniref:universal stress protein n=1 Tax=Haloparvum sedimenti TaxID=1678448 RepID=UPI00071E799F|nr:universal stress protein [Haloparvum sedimenti]
MKRLLLAIDESIERATAQAETVLDLFSGDDVVAYLLHDFVDNPEGASVSQVDAVTRAESILTAEGVTVEFRERSGEPAPSIVETADELDADAICVAGRKRTPAGKVLFGSVSQSVILQTERPVIVCSPQGPETDD